MSHHKIALGLCLLCSLGLIMAGCSSTSEDNPTNPGTTPTLTLTGSQAEDYSVSALEMVNSLVTSVPDFASADFTSWNQAKANQTKAQGDSIQWDPTEQAYTYEFDGPLFELTPPNSWTLRVGMWVQYRDAAGTPLQYPIGAMEMEMDYTTGMTMHVVDETSVSDLDYDMDTNLTVSYLGQGESYGIAGTGSTIYTVSQITPTQSQSGQFSMDWSLDLTATPDGCPSGTATVNCQDFVLNASYDGQGGVTWTLVGGNYQASGSEVLTCGQPVN